MQLIHSEIIPEYLRDLLVDFHDACTYQSLFPQSTFFQRTCKVPEIDVKLTLKLSLIYSLQEPTEEAGAAATFCVTAKWTINTDCINLRRNRTFFGDSEHVTLTTEIPRELPTDDLRQIYGVFADLIIQRLDEFKLCIECRNLYMDKRFREIHQMVCSQCLFDRIFHTDDLMCVICKDNAHREEQTYTLTCGHSYHSYCILTNFIKINRRQCPLCREIDGNNG